METAIAITVVVLAAAGVAWSIARDLRGKGGCAGCGGCSPDRQDEADRQDETDRSSPCQEHGP